MSLSPADVIELDALVPLNPLLDTDMFPILRAMPLQFATVAEMRQAMVGAPGSLRWYGGVGGKPDSAEVLFAIEMVGDEILDVGLPGSSGRVAVAPAGNVTFTLAVNGVTIGTMTIAAGQTVAAFALAAPYIATAGDLLTFTAPSPQDASLSQPSYTILARR